MSLTADTIQHLSAVGREVCRTKIQLNWLVKQPEMVSRKKKIDPSIIDYLYFGISITQHHLFYSHNWAAGSDGQ